MCMGILIKLAYDLAKNKGYIIKIIKITKI